MNEMTVERSRGFYPRARADATLDRDAMMRLYARRFYPRARADAT